MKKIIPVILLVLLSLAACQSSGNTEATIKDVEVTSPETEVERGECDFRNAKWGDSIEDVKKYENEIENLIEQETVHGTTIYGFTNVIGYDADVLFLFEDEKFCIGSYSFRLNYLNAGQYIQAYDLLKKSLSEKYGKPSSDIIKPLTDQKLIEYAGEATALELGYVHYATIWETDTTNILLSMVAEGIKINLNIVYIDNTYEDSNIDGL